MLSSRGSATKCLLLALAACAAGCASVLEEDGALAVVPYRVSDTERIIISAHINGMGPFDFAVDTGASISVVFEEATENTGIQPHAGREILIHGMLGSGQYPTARIARLTVGAEVWADAEVAIMPGETPATAELDGILGIDFLSHYAVGYSSRERVLRLYAPEVVAARSYIGWSSIPLRRLRTATGATTLRAINIEIAGRSIPALLDLGAGTNMMNDRAFHYVGERLRMRRKDIELSGAVGSTVVRTELEVDIVKTGNLRWRDKRFLIEDVHVLEILRLDSRPVAIVGADFFNQRDFVIDFARSRLLVRSSD